MTQNLLLATATYPGQSFSSPKGGSSGEKEEQKEQGEELNADNLI